MPIEATSQHLRNAHELLLLVPLKTGFVQTPEQLTSYPSRLRSVLALLFRPTQSSAERTLMPSSSFIDKLQNIYHFHYGVVEHLQRPHLLLSATFDSSWETYFHNLVDNVGHFLDAIFCHCEGFDGRSCADGYEAFADFIREHQVQSGIFYSAHSDLTVDDIRILRKVARGRSPAEPIGDAKSESTKDIKAWEERNNELRGADEFKSGRERDLERLALSMWDVRALFPVVQELPGRSAQSIFDAAAGQLIKAFMEANAPAKLQPKLPVEVATWMSGLLSLPTPPSAQSVSILTRTQLHNVQGNILKPYERPTSSLGLMVMMRLPIDGSREVFLRELAKMVTTADAQLPPLPGADPKPNDGLRVNVAFTLAGMRRLGLGDEVLDRFPKEFREGMEARAGLLGDIGYPNHPSYWPDLTLDGLDEAEAGDAQRFRLSDIDLLLTAQADAASVKDDHRWHSKHPLHDRLQERLEKLGARSLVLRVEPLRLGKDHFGLFDPQIGESQPEPRVRIEGEEVVANQSAGAVYDNTIALGDLLLGHPDKRNQVARSAQPGFNPSSWELFKDGSFLVVRKLRQNSKEFEDYLNSQAKSGASADRVRELLTGRDAKGQTLVVPPPGKDPVNAFNYSNDAQGSKCPFAAHVRKTNPRTASTPRIMRRSLPYGPDYAPGVSETPAQDRGLMFMAYNASIAEQYETIQRWITGGNSTGQLSSYTDVLGGGQLPLQGSAPGQKPLIQVNWGMYLFVPSLTGLGFLAAQRPSVPALRTLGGSTATGNGHAGQARSSDGAAVLAKLHSIKDPDEARAAWKRLLEEGAYTKDADALWEHVLASGEPYDTPYGVLVADLDKAQDILADDGRKFSVRSYWHRLRDVIGGHYLALDLAHPAADATSSSNSDVIFGQRIDQGPSYDELASEPNRVIRERFTMDGAYGLAHAATEKFLRGGTTFDVRELAKYVVGTVAKKWFDLPEDNDPLLTETRALMQHYVVISRFCFYPHPEPWQQDDVHRAGAALREASGKVATLKSEMAQGLSGTYRTEADIRLAMTGALVGFVPPTLAHIVGIIVRGFEEGELLAVARSVADKPFADVRKVLLGPVLKSITDHPIPTILYRTALEGSGYTRGTTVVLGTQVISREARRRQHSSPEQWLFGGQPRETGGSALHGCPARDPAIGILLGVLSAVARYTPLERASPLRFSYS